MRIRERVCLALSVVIVLVAVGATFWRIRHAIDFTDEAFYAALPYRFALGDRPWVDELNIGQSSGIILYPFVKAYVIVRGSTGIMFYMRVLYILFFSGVGWTVYRLATLRLPKYTALILGATCIPFFPYAIPSLSYNTLGAGLLAVSLFTTTRALLDRPEKSPKAWADPLAWGGFALGAATFAYPSLLLVAVLVTFIVFAAASGRRVDSTLRFAMGGGAFALVVSPTFLFAGRAAIQKSLAYSGAGGMSITFAKVEAMWDVFFAQHRELPMLYVATAVAIIFARRAPRLVIFVVPLLPLLARGAVVSGVHTTLGYLSSLALVAPLFALALRDKRVAFMTVLGVWVPSALAGVTSAVTSGNGAIAAGVGLFPAGIAGVLLLAMWVHELARPIQMMPLRYAFGFTAPMVALYVLVKLTLDDSFIYRDSSLALLTAQITEGPYKGIYTTPQRKRLLASMSADIATLVRGKPNRVLFYYDFPIGYMIAERPPLAPSAWLFAFEPRMSMDADHVATHATQGDVIVKITCGWISYVSCTMNPVNPLDREVQARTESSGGQRSGYEVFIAK